MASTSSTLEEAQSLILINCEQMLAGELSYIAGSRVIINLCHLANVSNDDPDYIAFVAIESETDDIPLGKMRDQWSDVAIAKHQASWEHAEEWATEFGKAAAKNFTRRFGIK